MEHGPRKNNSGKRQGANHTTPRSTEAGQAEQKRDRDGYKRTEPQRAQRQGADHHAEHSGDKQGKARVGGHDQRRHSDNGSSPRPHEQRNNAQTHGDRPDSGSRPHRGDRDRRQRPDRSGAHKPPAASGASGLPGTNSVDNSHSGTTDVSPRQRRLQRNKRRGQPTVGDVGQRAKVEQSHGNADADRESGDPESAVGPSLTVAEVEVTVTNHSSSDPTESVPAETSDAETPSDEVSATDPEVEVPEAEVVTPPPLVEEAAESEDGMAAAVPSSKAAEVADLIEAEPLRSASTDSEEVSPHSADEEAKPADESVDNPTEQPADPSHAVEVETAHPAGTPSDTSAAPSETAEKLTLDTVELFDDFLRYVQELDGDLKPFEMRKNSPARITVAKPNDLSMTQDRIAVIAARDTKLATALALLLTTERSDLSGAARKNVMDLAAQILNQHAAFVDDEPFRNRVAQLRTGEADTKTFSQTIVRLRNLVERPFAGSESLKTPALQALLDNAVHIVVLLTSSAAQWDVSQYIDALAEHVWDVDTVYPGSAADREKLASIPKTARRAAAVIVRCSRERIRVVESERDAARVRVDASQAEIVRLSEELAATRNRVKELEAEIVDAHTALQQETSARRSERMGATSDFEVLRVDTAHVIAQQVESLEDALDALSHGQTQITEEFVRRSVNTLRRSMSTLQPRTTQDSQGDPE